MVLETIQNGVLIKMESVARKIMDHRPQVPALAFGHIICRIPEQISKKELDNLPNDILAEVQKLKWFDLTPCVGLTRTFSVKIHSTSTV